MLFSVVILSFSCITYCCSNHITARNYIYENYVCHTNIYGIYIFLFIYINIIVVKQNKLRYDI